MGIPICTECFDKNFLPFENNIDRKYTFTFHEHCSVCGKEDHQHICITTMPVDGQSSLLTIKHYLLEYEITYLKEEAERRRLKLKSIVPKSQVLTNKYPHLP